MDQPGAGCGTRPLMGCFTIFLAMFLLIGGFLFVVDQRCHTEMNRFFVIYEGAEVVSTEYNFIRAQGVGRTIIHLQSDDNYLDIGGWYGNHFAQYLRDRRISRVRYFSRRAPAGADHATDIYLVGYCFQGDSFTP